MGRSRSRSRSRDRDRRRRSTETSPPRGRRGDEGRRREEPRRDSRRRSRSRERYDDRRSYDKRHERRPSDERGGRYDARRGGSPPRRRSPAPREQQRSSRSRSRERMPPPRDRQPLPPQDMSYRERGGDGVGLGARPDRRTCHKCGEEGHIARDCPQGGGGGSRLCHKCKQPGHIARECPNAPVDDEAGMRWGKGGQGDEEEQLPEKEPEPDFGLSGALAAETNKHESGVVLQHQEPAEARKPTQRWRLYVFKSGEPLGDPLHIHRQSRYMLGRERRVADIPTDHPSCSKQHAVIQFRLTEKEGADGMMKAAVRPYIMDLGSTNGTFLNGERVEAQRYYELLEKDMLRFGNSSREYVLILEK